jgi:hypothetical protein
MRHPPTRSHHRANPLLARLRNSHQESVARFRIIMSDPIVSPSNRPPDSVFSNTHAAPVDGIRWELVNRMKALIAEGQLDTPERWALAEEMLFRTQDDRR